MEHLVTSPEGATAPSITEVVVETSPLSVSGEEHDRRLVKIREAIQSGDYRVSAADLADSLLRCARRAN